MKNFLIKIAKFGSQEKMRKYYKISKILGIVIALLLLIYIRHNNNLNFNAFISFAVLICFYLSKCYETIVSLGEEKIHNSKTSKIFLENATSFLYLPSCIIAILIFILFPRELCKTLGIGIALLLWIIPIEIENHYKKKKN